MTASEVADYIKWSFDGVVVTKGDKASGKKVDKK